MTRLILFAILAFVVARLAWRLLTGIFVGMGYQPPSTRGRGSSVGLVRDPVCGTFVLPSKALTTGSGPDTRYFCSEKCRRDYAARG
jgi:YHS domain-containing protein